MVTGGYSYTQTAKPTAQDIAPTVNQYIQSQESKLVTPKMPESRVAKKDISIPGFLKR